VGVLFVLVAYLAAERVRLNRFIKSGRRIPSFYRYFSTFVETSFPTVEIMVSASFIDPATTLSMPPVFIYPLFIALSALRLNFRLSVFTGAVAALEYTLAGERSEVVNTFGRYVPPAVVDKLLVEQAAP
jgi:adenylate cyclase